MFTLQDAAETLRDFRDGLDFSDEEFDRIESRLSLLRRLERKYNTDEAGLIDLLDSIRKRLDQIEYAGDRLQKLELRAFTGFQHVHRLPKSHADL